jgi:adenine-specific DNA-methyltransferase
MSLFESPRIYSDYAPEARIVLHCGDTQAFLETLPEASVHLVITSPPYNLGKAYERKTTIDRYLQSQERVIEELVRVLHPEGSLCWQVGNFVDEAEVFPLDIFYYPILKRYRLILRTRIIWHFEHGLHASKRFSGRYEALLWFTKTDHYVFNLDDVRVPSKYPGKTHFKGPNRGKPSGNPKGKNPSDLWRFAEEEWDRQVWDIPNVKSNHPEKTIHPCQFPIELVMRCVIALTHPNDVVLDPYCGVGSALIAGHLCDRRAWGVDKEPPYIDVAKQRFQDYFEGRLRIRPMGRPIHTPTGREKVSRTPPEWLEDLPGGGRPS